MFQVNSVSFHPTNNNNNNKQIKENSTDPILWSSKKAKQTRSKQTTLLTSLLGLLLYLEDGEIKFLRYVLSPLNNFTLYTLDND
jgi:hypothetical protein